MDAIRGAMSELGHAIMSIWQEPMDVDAYKAKMANRFNQIDASVAAAF